jgi:alpha-ribazole phosphatase
MRLVLVRHGESVLGRARRYAGHTDTPLHPSARRRLDRVRRRFARLKPDRVFSSDLLRCRETAAAVAPGKDVVFSARLRELRFGRWEGLTADECRARHPRLFERWSRDPLRHAPPGGESLRRLRTRVRAFVAGLARRFPGRTVALITHGGPIRTLLAGRPEEFWTPRVPPGSLHVLDWKEVARRR